MHRHYGPWPVWLGATVGTFAVLEYAAVQRSSFPPLTRYLQHLLGIHPKSRVGRLAPALFLAFWAWLTAHLVSDVVEAVSDS